MQIRNWTIPTIQIDINYLIFHLPQEVCVFAAAIIHYFYTVAFAWMLFEGVYLYMMVVKVFNTVVRMRLFYIISWGGCVILSLVDITLIDI